jgi:hypothetical protein
MLLLLLLLFMEKAPVCWWSCSAQTPSDKCRPSRNPTSFPNLKNQTHDHSDKESKKQIKRMGGV